MDNNGQNQMPNTNNQMNNNNANMNGNPQNNMGMMGNYNGPVNNYQGNMNGMNNYNQQPMNNYPQNNQQPKKSVDVNGLMDKAKEFFNKNRKIVLIAIAVIVVILLLIVFSGGSGSKDGYAYVCTKSYTEGGKIKVDETWSLESGEVSNGKSLRIHKKYVFAKVDGTAYTEDNRVEIQKEAETLIGMAASGTTTTTTLDGGKIIIEGTTFKIMYSGQNQKTLSNELKDLGYKCK